MTVTWVDAFLMGSLFAACCTYCYWRGRRVEAQYWISHNEDMIATMNRITEAMNSKLAARLAPPKPPELRQ